jgi:nucleotide-binding universal stress UspA family protein
MTHVLIAVDDNDTSVATARTALRLFGEGADYTVLNVAHNAPVKWGDDALEYGTVYPLAVPGAGVIGGVPLVVRSTDASDRTTDRVEAAQQIADELAHEAGIPSATAVGDTGDPADAIISAARHQGADVVVVGTHERGWFKRLFTSSVSDSVIREVEIPVLVAR